MSDAELKLEVGGRVFTGWKDVVVTRSMETLADSFSLTYTDRWLPSGIAEKVSPNQSCIVSIDDEKIIVGYVDSSDTEFTSTDHTLSAAGRSKAADLVDCSVVRKGGPWVEASLADIASDICGPFGIDVIDQSGDAGEAIPRFALEPGETAFEVLQRLCKLRGALPIAVQDTLVFVRSIGGSADRTATVLRYGDNLKSGKRSRDYRDRFSEYTFFAQTSRIGDVYTEETANAWTRRILDEEITRYRPMRIWCEVGADKGALVRRAVWERNVRRGRSDQVTYVVQGWQNKEGKAWGPYMLITVEDTVNDVSGEWLITQATLSRSAEGTVTELSLMRPEAFSVEVPLPEKKATKRKRPKP